MSIERQIRDVMQGEPLLEASRYAGSSGLNVTC